MFRDFILEIVLLNMVKTISLGRSHAWLFLLKVWAWAVLPYLPWRKKNVCVPQDGLLLHPGEKKQETGRKPTVKHQETTKKKTRKPEGNHQETQTKNTHPTITSLRPLQLIPPHPRDFNSWRILASRSILAVYSAVSTGKGYSAGCSAGSTGNPLASNSGGILGGVHWRATGTLSGILGGIHWRPALVLSGVRATLAGYSAGSTLRCSTGCSAGGILGGIHE